MPGLIFTLIIRVIFGLIAASIASRKGRSSVGWFFGGFFLILIGVIIVACLSNKTQERSIRRHADLERRRLREQLMQERMKNEAFRAHASNRLDTHDRMLGTRTRSPLALHGGSVDRLSFDASEPAMELGAPPPAPPQAAPPPPPAEGQWYVALQGQTRGPVAETRLREWLVSGKLKGDTPIMPVGGDRWCAAGRTEQFRGCINPNPSGYT